MGFGPGLTLPFDEFFLCQNFGFQLCMISIPADWKLHLIVVQNVDYFFCQIINGKRGYSIYYDSPEMRSDFQQNWQKKLVKWPSSRDAWTSNQNSKLVPFDYFHLTKFLQLTKFKSDVPRPLIRIQNLSRLTTYFHLMKFLQFTEFRQICTQ